MSEPAANICVAKECRKVWQVTRLVVIPAAKVATRKNFYSKRYAADSKPV